MKIAIAGHSGFLGTAFIRENGEYDYVKLDREQLYGDAGTLRRYIEDTDVVMNLAGASIFRLWTGKNRRKILASREEVNRNLVSAVNGLKEKKPRFISASAIHIYSGSGSFLREVAERWEAPLNRLDDDVRKVVLRIAVVLGRGGGAMVPLRIAGKFGFSAIMGSGKQYFSFIHMDDWVAAVRYILDNDLEGIFDLAAPYPVDYAKFARVYADVAGVPFRIRIPASLLKLTLGETRTIVTDSHYITPEGLTREGFRFRFPDIGSAMKNLVS